MPFTPEQEILLDKEKEFNKLLDLVNNKKISEDEFIRRREALDLKYKKKLEELETKERAKKAEQNKDSPNSTTNKPTEKPVKQLKSEISQEDFKKLPEEDKLKYGTSSSLNSVNLKDCIEAFNKVAPLISAMTPISSVMGPVSNITEKLQPIMSTLQPAANALQSSIGTAESFSLKVLEIEVAKPIIQTVLQPIKDMLSLATSAAALGYAIYTQGPDAYRNIKKGLQTLNENKTKYQEMLTKSKKITESKSKLDEEQTKKKKEAEEKAKKDKSKNWTKTVSETRSSSSVVVISDETYKRLSPEEQKTYHEQTTSEKIAEAVKQVELPQEIKSLINQADSLVSTAESLYNTIMSTAGSAQSFVDMLDSLSTTVKTISMMFGSEIPSIDDITKTIKTDGSNIDLLENVKNLSNKFSSFKPNLFLKKKN